MADVQDAMDVVQQKQADSRMVGSLLSRMGQMVRTPSGSADSSMQTASSLVEQPAGEGVSAEPTALQKTRGVGADGAPDMTAAATSGSGSGDLAAFMGADTAEESGGDPNATNARTGASGTFQIMPSNWPSWAKDAGVDPGDHSAAAQQKVAANKMQEYYDQFGSWGAVAVAWYAGPNAAAHWLQNPNAPMYNAGQGPGGREPSINAYVANVLGAMKARAGGQG